MRLKADPVAWAASRARHNERRRTERADPVEWASERAYERQRSRAKRREVWAAANRLCAICAVNPVPFGLRRFCRECKALRAYEYQRQRLRAKRREVARRRLKRREVLAASRARRREWRREWRRKELADPVKRAIEWEYHRQRSRDKRREVWAAANRLCAICDVNPVPFGPGVRRFCDECKALRKRSPRGNASGRCRTQVRGATSGASMWAMRF